jgi:hypothetical protein
MATRVVGMNDILEGHVGSGSVGTTSASRRSHNRCDHHTPHPATTTMPVAPTIHRNGCAWTDGNHGVVPPVATFTETATTVPTEAANSPATTSNPTSHHLRRNDQPPCQPAPNSMGASLLRG